MSVHKHHIHRTDKMTRILLWWSSRNNHGRRGSCSFPLLHSGVSVLTLATSQASHEGLLLLWTMTLKKVHKHKPNSNSVFLDSLRSSSYLLGSWWCFRHTDWRGWKLFQSNMAALRRKPQRSPVWWRHVRESMTRDLHMEKFSKFSREKCLLLS